MKKNTEKKAAINKSEGKIEKKPVAKVEKNANKTTITEDKLYTGIDLSKSKIILVKPTEKDIRDYINQLNMRNDINFSLNSFLQEIYGGKGKIIISDLSNMEISNPYSQSPLNLQRANFRGSFFSKTRFFNCDLQYANFADTKLHSVIFKYSNISRVDFRGCNLETCQFGREYMDQPYSNIEGVKISLSPSELRIFADIKGETARKNEQQRLIDIKRIEQREVSFFTSPLDKFLYFVGSGKDTKYKRVTDELKQMENGIFERDYIVHKSIKILFDNDSLSFYPVYEKFLKDAKEIKRKKYVKISRQDLEEFIALKGKKLPSLNEFAKDKYLKSQPRSTATDDKVTDNTIIIADISSNVNKFGNNEWNRINLTGLNFTGRDLSYTNFAGSDLSKCQLNNCNLKGVNMDCGKFTETVFNNCNINDASFIGAHVENCTIENSGVVRSNFSWCTGSGLKIDGSDFSYSNFRHSDLSKFTVINSKFTGVILDDSNIYKAYIENCQLVDCAMNNVQMNMGKLYDVKIENCLLNAAKMRNNDWRSMNMLKTEANYLDLTGTVLQKGSKIVKNNLKEAIFDGFKASFCKMSDNNLDSAKFAYAKIANSDLSNCLLRFSEFDCCTFINNLCNESDFTKAQIFNTQMTESNFDKSNFWFATIKASNLNQASFKEANWFAISISKSELKNSINNQCRVNDATDITNSIVKEILGEFNYYNKENLMSTLNLEQFIKQQKKIHAAVKIGKLSKFTQLFNYIYRKHRIGKADCHKILQARLDSLNKFEQYIQDPASTNCEKVNEFRFRATNLINGHNI